MFFKKNKIIIAVILILNMLLITSCSDKTPKKNINNKEVKNLGVKYEYNSGVLLGFRNDNKNGTSTYKTMWISPVNGELKLVKEGKDILFPYGSEFWKIEHKTYNFDDKESFVEYFDAHSASEKEKKRQIDKSKNELIKTNCKLNFVGNKYVSFETNFNYKSEKSQNISLNKVMVTDISKIVENIDQIEKISLKNVFNKFTIEKFINQNMLEGTIKDSVNEGKEYDKDWGIFRENAKWVAKFAKTNKQRKNGAYEENYEFIDIPYDLPEIIKCYDDLMFDFDIIKEKHPNAIDAISSPTKDIIIIITDKKIMVYPCTSKITGNPSMIQKPVLTIDKDQNESLIMAQWATGDYVDKWNNEVLEYLK